MQSYVGKICPVCKKELTAYDRVKICPDCGIPHHEQCWEMNSGCSTFGCEQQGVCQPKAAAVDKCLKCGTILEAGQEFCPRCGTPRGEQRQNQADSTESIHVAVSSPVGNLIKQVAIVLEVLGGIGAFLWFISDAEAFTFLIALVVFLSCSLSCLLIYGFGEIICLLTSIDSKT